MAQYITDAKINYLRDDTCGISREMLAAFTQSFEKAHKKYGPSWRRYRPYGTGMIKRIDNKIKRIETIQNGTVQMVKNESIETNFVEIVTYGILYLINIERANKGITNDQLLEYSVEDIQQLHATHCDRVIELMRIKNNDYGEAWKDMSLEELADEIAVKIDRMYVPVKNRDFKTVIENIEDVINYGLFSLIHIRREQLKRDLDPASDHQ